MKMVFSCNSVPRYQTRANFGTHALTAQLLWFVPNFGMISLYKSGWEQDKIHIKSELQAKTPAWSGQLPNHAMLTGQTMWHEISYKIKTVEKYVYIKC